MRGRIICLAVVLGLLAGPLYAAVSVPSIFGSHMVVQQGQAVPVWGKAEPGEEVSVSLGGHTAKATADSAGKWRVDLPKVQGEGALQLVVAGKENTLTFDDVLAGEVWIGSGQSNMQWTVKDSNDAEKEIAAAQYPEIRLFYVERKVAAEPQEDCNGEWMVCTPESVPGFSAVLYFFGRDLHRELKQPVGLIHTSWGGTPAESWTSREKLLSDPALKVIADRWDGILEGYPEALKKHEEAMAAWKAAAEKAKAEGRPEPRQPGGPMGPDHPHRASGLYNAMIAPLVPYGFKGAIWYQGESNAGRAYQYRQLFPAMITDWRERWGQGDFPFYFVQLANFTDTLPEPADSDWAELREAQTMTLSLKNTGMAVAIDIGEAKDIHPRNKQDVGKRLALNALAKDYGRDVVWSGPMYKRMSVEKGAAHLWFDHAEGGLAAQGGGALKGFAVAGADQKFVWADARIDGDKVVVSSPGVAEPVAVRYAWANNPECNLCNGAGLPASPFRTDDWPGVTAGAE